MRPFYTARSRIELGWLAVGIAWVATLLFAVAGFWIGDEWVHWNQVRRFLHGDYHVYEDWLTNIPGYHWLLAGMLWPFGLDALGWGRAISGVFTLICVMLFHRIRMALHPADAQRAAAQFLFLPTLFVYGFLAYTDVPALMFLLGALLATLRGRHMLSALLLVASMAIRQNNVLWVGFLALYAAWPILREAVMAWRGQAGERDPWWRWAGALLALGWPYAVAVACFCAYWAINGSIAYSTAQSQHAHPDVRLDVGNPVYLLAIAAVLFPLQVVAGWGRLTAFGSCWRGAWIWLLPLAAFAVYAWLFEVHHPFNFIVERNLRNQWLQLVAQGGVAWWVFGALATLGFCGLLFQRYVVPQGWLWLPFSLLFVGASWMIETRYTIVPFVLFLALRRPGSAWVERVTLAGWVVLSAWLALNVFDLRFML